ncbi:MAG: DUF3341 domain-containing protein [Anaerolineae bacterium]|nr:DUF3341 domain-containing protein [Anaerolineae bacterium]
MTESAQDKNPLALYGVMAEFETPEALVKAARRVREEGYRAVDAFAPFEIEELGDVLHARNVGLPLIVLGGGVTGLVTGFALQYWTTVIDYPLDIGGRPLASWPAFVPVSFELTILFASFAALLGMLALNHLPMPYHPVFNVPRFGRASQDRFFLLIEARDRFFRHATTRKLLEELGAYEVSDVEP